MEAVGAEVSEKDAAVEVPICVNGPVDEDERSTLNPLSLDELSVQLRSIRLEEVAVAPRALGEAGTLSEVVALSTFDGAEVPAALYALTR